jgi:hypothetical protein
MLNTIDVHWLMCTMNRVVLLDWWRMISFDWHWRSYSSMLCVTWWIHEHWIKWYRVMCITSNVQYSSMSRCSTHTMYFCQWQRWKERQINIYESMRVSMRNADERNEFNIRVNLRMNRIIYTYRYNNETNAI